MGLLDALFDPQFRQDVRRGLLDAGNRGFVGGLLGAPVDLAAMALRPLGYTQAAPVGGSEWIGQKMQAAGAVSGQRNPMAEALAGFVDPATLGAGAVKALPLLAGMAARPKYWDSLVEVLKAGTAADVPFGKVAASTEKRVNALRDALGQPLIQRGDQWVIPQNVVQKLIDKRMGEGGMSAERVADTLNSAVHSTRNRVFQSEYPQIQGLLTPREGRSNLSYVGVNPKTGEPVVKTGFQVSTRRGDEILGRGSELLPAGGTQSAIVKPPLESGSTGAYLPGYAGSTLSMPQPGYSPQYRAAQRAGLDMSFDARMKRAAEQGYQPGWYHGSADDLAKFAPEAWLTRSPQLAADYAAASEMQRAQGLGGGNVLPVMLRTQDMPSFGGRGRAMFDVGDTLREQSAGKPGFIAKNVTDEAYARYVADPEYGYSVSENMPDVGRSAVALVRDPSRIRSVNAAFDPANIGKPDLLGRIDPALLPWLAAGGLGAAYATQKGLLSE